MALLLLFGIASVMDCFIKKQNSKPLYTLGQNMSPTDAIATKENVKFLSKLGNYMVIFLYLGLLSENSITLY